jgi:hypothetical protein
MKVGKVKEGLTLTRTSGAIFFCDTEHLVETQLGSTFTVKVTGHRNLNCKQERL